LLNVGFAPSDYPAARQGASYTQEDFTEAVKIAARVMHERLAARGVSLSV
jgi:hypothetical protein